MAAESGNENEADVDHHVITQAAESCFQFHIMQGMFYPRTRVVP